MKRFKKSVTESSIKKKKRNLCLKLKRNKNKIFNIILSIKSATPSFKKSNWNVVQNSFPKKQKQIKIRCFPYQNFSHVLGLCIYHTLAAAIQTCASKKQVLPKSLKMYSQNHRKPTLKQISFQQRRNLLASNFTKKRNILPHRYFSRTALKLWAYKNS